MKHPTVPGLLILPAAGLVEYASDLLNPDDPPGKRLPLTAAVAIARYFLHYPDREKGLLIQTDSFMLTPFRNAAPESTQSCLVRMEDNEDFNRLAEMAQAGKIWGWAHSHPTFEPFPSGIDIRHHQYKFNMVIFSCRYLTFTVNSAADIETLEQLRCSQSERTLVNV